MDVKLEGLVVQVEGTLVAGSYMQCNVLGTVHFQKSSLCVMHVCIVDRVARMRGRQHRLRSGGGDGGRAAHTASFHELGSNTKLAMAAHDSKGSDMAMYWAILFISVSWW